ncbi:MAG: pirin family protein [Pseudomonadota bacterium]
MITVRKSADRGFADHGWLQARHTFSFANYYDPAHMHFRHLRVINEDRIAAGGGFPMHSHQDMEIITYIIDGALEHRDTLGNGEILRPGEIQRMSAGTGITHSEFNPSESDSTHLLQIWLLTEQKGIEPDYEQRSFIDRRVDNELCLLATRGGGNGTVHVNQDVNLYTATLEQGASIALPVSDTRHAWIQVVRGEIDVAGHTLEAGDGVGTSGESDLRLKANADSEFLLFDLA